MIPDFFINFAYNVIAFIIGIFPSSNGFDTTTYAAATAIGGYTGIFAPIVDFRVLGSCVAIAFGVEVAVFGFKTFKWVWSHVPIFGGNG